jgi:hypothetical protein
MDTYTGKHRFRIEKRRFKSDLVVLQLEIKYWDYCVNIYMCKQITRWIDAPVQVLLTTNLPEEGTPV